MPARSRQALSRGAPVLRTAPVLAVLVCHNGAEWLRQVLSALRHSSPRPRHVLAVDTGSSDGTAALLADAAQGADRVVDGVLTLDSATGYAAAVHAAVDHAVERWGDPGGWIWLLHDDSAPDPDCLGTLLLAAEVSPSAGVLGPLVVDWYDPRLVVAAGLSTDASGHHRTGVGPSEPDWGRLGRGQDGQAYQQSTEVLAVPSAGLLVRRAVWDRLGGFDRAFGVLREDVDFGWRANRAGHVVLCVPSARLRHVRALATGRRAIAADTGRLGTRTRAVDRGHGLRAYLVNCAAVSFLLGVPRLTLLCLLRALGFALLRRLPDARAELRALGYLLAGGARLRSARAARKAIGTSSVRGLFTSRPTRFRAAVRAGISTLVRRRVQADAALGRLPSDYDPAAVWLPPEAAPRPPLKPDLLPEGVQGRPRRTGLRRPAPAMAVALPTDLPTGSRPSPAPRPSPVRRDGSTPEPELLLVRVDRTRVLRALALSPPLLLLVGLSVLAVVVNSGRWGIDLAGGRLLPVPDLGQVWSDYVATWHGVAGGTAAPAPTALAVLGVLGTVAAPWGGPAAVVAFLFLADLPLAGLSAYLATRRAPVHRWVRALLAVGYALLPPATAAVSQGRLDAVVVHILLPLVTSGVTSLLVRGRTGDHTWLATTAGTAIGLAVTGAFAPLAHLTLVVLALVGFVLVPGAGTRRGAGLFLLVLMPLALLLPWPAVVIQHPGVVLQGVGAPLPTPAPSVLDLVGLHAGGPGAWPWIGAVVVLAPLVGLALRPGRDALPGLGLAALGVAGVALTGAVSAMPLAGGAQVRAWAGVPLLIVGWGLLWALLGVVRTGGARVVVPVHALVGAGLVAIAVLAVGAVGAGRSGPLETGGGPRLVSTVAAELRSTGRSVLVVGDSVRQVVGRMPRFGDDDLAPTPSASTRLGLLVGDLLAAEENRVQAAVSRAAVIGVLYLVLPDAETGEAFRRRAGGTVEPAPAVSDGRPVFRILVPSGAVYLTSPDVARQALTGGRLPAGADGVVPVDARPPGVAVRVSDGAEGRLLVLTAEEEPGWQATVDGRPVPVVRVWGSAVAVNLPTRAAEVRVEQPGGPRGALLLVQAALALFILLTAIPARPERPD
ncbi:glycosyltransferase [Actinokineospora auranticolor]|uniref:GT2 family glycosyltransferase n=1 Tax=Actinokineospora auranticolor TaxID=155976 RepID=A0A2S6GX47_9PSEU|nr:glycosyltransferase family 2 protein [Actinokineospora auranticolor]PPK69815.1 GT2 family glycosyltransferase [Actinokineospora auranticolor]